GTRGAETPAWLPEELLTEGLHHVAHADPRGADGLAAAADDATVQVAFRLRGELDRALRVSAHEVDAAPRRVGLTAAHAVGRAVGKTEAAVDAVQGTAVLCKALLEA